MSHFCWASCGSYALASSVAIASCAIVITAECVACVTQFDRVAASVSCPRSAWPASRVELASGFEPDCSSRLGLERVSARARRFFSASAFSLGSLR